MKKLVFEFLGERKSLASVYSNLDGTFRLEAEDPDAKEYFSGLINKISQEKPVLPLMAGQTDMQSGKIIEKTIQKQVPSTDVEYLSALWDYHRFKIKNMGTSVNAKCSNCGYTKERVSYPDRDRGFVAICESTICLDEKELVVVTVDYDRNPRSRYWELLKTHPNLESKLGKCPSCHGTSLEAWHRQCPKCGESISVSPAGNWD